MALKFLRTFVVNDENNVDFDGERILNAGIDLTRANKNCPAFYNHRRLSRWDDHEEVKDNVSGKLPIGQWKNFRVEGDVMLADYYYDSGSDFSSEIARMIEDEVIKGASPKFRYFAFSDAPEDLIDGQTGFTITKSQIFEISIVDIPNDENTLAKGLMDVMKEKSIDPRSNNCINKLDDKQNVFEKSAYLYQENFKSKNLDMKVSDKILGFINKLTGKSFDENSNQEDVEKALEDYNGEVFKGIDDLSKRNEAGLKGVSDTFKEINKAFGEKIAEKLSKEDAEKMVDKAVNEALDKAKGEFTEEINKLKGKSAEGAEGDGSDNDNDAPKSKTTEQGDNLIIETKSIDDNLNKYLNVGKRK